MRTFIQSIIFHKSVWDLRPAKAWLRKHNFNTEPDEKLLTYRFRQVEPSSRFKYRTIKLSNTGISFVMGMDRYDRTTARSRLF